LVLSSNPTESLPTPSGTPAPSEPSGEAVDHLSTMQDQHIPPIIVQREPTPSLMAHVDQASQKPLMHGFLLIPNAFCSQPHLENRSASPDVFRSLDQCSS
jgi:hypothetical protein